MNGISFAVFAANSTEIAKRTARALRRRTAWKISQTGNTITLTGIIAPVNEEPKSALFDYQHFMIVCGGIGSILVDYGVIQAGFSSTTIETPDWEEEIGVMYLPASATSDQIVDVFSETLGIGHYLGRGVVTEDGIRLVRELPEG